MFILQTHRSYKKVIGLYDSLEESKLVADQYAIDKSEIVTVSSIKMNELDNPEYEHNILYCTNHEPKPSKVTFVGYLEVPEIK